MVEAKGQTQKGFCIASACKAADATRRPRGDVRNIDPHVGSRTAHAGWPLVRVCFVAPNLVGQLSVAEQKKIRSGEALARGTPRLWDGGAEWEPRAGGDGYDARGRGGC